jgi:hypothetical protein
MKRLTCLILTLLPLWVMAQTQAPTTNLARFRLRFTFRDPYLSLPEPSKTSSNSSSSATENTPKVPPKEENLNFRPLQVSWKMNPDLAHQLEMKRLWCEDQATVPGFRVQIFSGTRRDAANSALLDFAERFPDEKVYLVNEQPYFKVRAGNFTTRIDAQALYSKVSSFYSSGAFVVPDNIRKY